MSRMGYDSILRKRKVLHVGEKKLTYEDHAGKHTILLVTWVSWVRGVAENYPRNPAEFAERGDAA